LLLLLLLLCEVEAVCNALMKALYSTEFSMRNIQEKGNKIHAQGTERFSLERRRSTRLHTYTSNGTHSCGSLKAN